jgi:hypothetical protein
MNPREKGINREARSVRQPSLLSWKLGFVLELRGLYTRDAEKSRRVTDQLWAVLWEMLPSLSGTQSTLTSVPVQDRVGRKLRCV